MQEAATYATGQTIAALGNSLSQKKEIMKGRKTKEDKTYHYDKGKMKTKK